MDIKEKSLKYNGILYFEIEGDDLKVLIGSNGGLTGIYLARNLSQYENIEIYGADSSKVSGGKFFVKKQFQLPNATASNFIDELINLINSEEIDIYLPTHSKETRVIAANEELIRSKCDVKFLISPLQTYKELEDKSIATRNLLEAGFYAPQIIEDFDCKYPIFMKKNIGSGSNGSGLIENEIIHKAYKNTCQNTSFFEYIEGKEYTVDCLFDCDGNLLGYNQRLREKAVGGAVSVSSIDNEFDILPWISKLAGIWKFCGCVNFQYILKDEKPYFIDINLRYPAGGLALSVAGGFDIPKLIIDMLSGNEISKEGFFPVRSDKKLRMYKYYEEIFEEI